MRIEIRISMETPGTWGSAAYSFTFRYSRGVMPVI